MSKTNPVAESNHEKLTELLNPLVDFMTKYNFHFFLVAGKDGLCSRYLIGDADDLSGMIAGIMNNNDVNDIIKDSITVSAIKNPNSQIPNQ
jgi:hypothetical protein